MTPEPEPDAEREPGVRPWRSLALLSAQHALIHGQSALLPLVYLAIIAEFGVTAATVALIAGAGRVVSGGIQLGFGAATRVVSRRILLGVGGLIFGVATALHAAAGGFVAFATANIVSMLGGSPQHPVGNALLVEQFPERRRGLAIAAHIAGGNLGTVAVGIVAAALVVAVGWRGSLLLLGVPAVVVALLILILVRESGADRASAVAAGTVREAYRRVVEDVGLRWLFLSAVLGGGSRGLGVVNVFVPLYLSQVVGLGIGTIGAMYAVLLAASVPGPLVAGWLSDRVGRKPMIVFVYLAAAASLVIFVMAGDDIVWLWVGIVLLSLFSFVESPQLQALLADIAPADLRDAAYSTYFALAFGIGSLWVILYGGVIAAAGETVGLGLVFWLMAAGAIGAAVAVLPIRLERHRSGSA